MAAWVLPGTDISLIAADRTLEQNENVAIIVNCLQQPKMMLVYQVICRLLVIQFAFFVFCEKSLARKTNQAVYEEPFDLAAGGAALTRASQEGVMFANPALMPYGGKFFRWFGFQLAPLANSDSFELMQGGGGSDDSESEDAQAEQIEQIFTTPLHFGVTTALSFITNNLGFGLFGRVEPDIKGERFDSTGIPVLRARAEAYYGAIASAAYRVLPWFSVGASLRYMYAAEPDIKLSFADTNAVQNLTSDATALQDELVFGRGIGADVGMLFFQQGDALDFRLALKADDIGDTKFVQPQEAFKQTVHGGLGITLHNSIDSLHLSVDYRDVLGVYEEQWAMRTYAGAKLILRNYVGFAAGLYQGYPTYGVRVDLLFVKLGVSRYVREMGEFPGDDGREIYVAYLGTGF